MKTLTEVKADVDRLAALIEAERSSALPTYGRTEDFARPHIEVDPRGYHLVVVERGQELSRITTGDLDELLYQVFRSVTFSLATRHELTHRVPARDPRRLMFQRQVELLARLSERWARREAEDHDRVLRRHPFDDAVGA